MEKMKLCVSTNWDPDLIEQLSDYPVYEYIGAMAATPIGGGRPSAIIPAPGKQEVETFIKKAHSKGIQFNYLLNASCMGNMEYDKTSHKRILDHLEWLCEIKVDSVTVSIPYLLEIIKNRFPGLKVKISVIARVNSIQMARFFESMGADNINLDFMCNRDFRFLEEVRKAVKCGLTLLVNELCLYQCPYRLYHYNVNSHESQDWTEKKAFILEYCILSCTIKQLSSPEHLIRARWIRPEDLGAYQQLGYHGFKISGRNYPSTWIARTVAAYASRQYPGNLTDILTGTISLDKKQQKYFSIDNRKLDNFLDFFRKQDCSGGCSQCSYCRSIAGKVITYYQEERQRILNFLLELKSNLITSKYFL